jgi:hypothetical protein
MWRDMRCMLADAKAEGGGENPRPIMTSVMIQFYPAFQIPEFRRVADPFFSEWNFVRIQWKLISGSGSPQASKVPYLRAKLMEPK